MVRPFGSVSRTWKALAAVVAMALVAVVLIATPGSATFAKKYDLMMSSTPSPVPVGTSRADQGDVHEQEPLLDRLGVVDGAVVTVWEVHDHRLHAADLGVVTLAPGGQSLSITGVNLILNKPYSITMTVSVTCEAATGSWGSTAKLFGGSTMFTLNNPGNAQKTTVSGACLNKISFDAGTDRTLPPAARWPR